MTLIKINRYAPAEARPRYAQILKSRLDEVAQHFVLSRFGLNKVRVLLYIVLELLLIFGHLEEIRFLLRVLHRSAAIGTAAVLELRFCPERLARRAVPALVFTLVYVALLIELFEYALHRLDMVIVRRADKSVIADIEHIGYRADLTGDLVNMLLRRYAGSLGDLLYFLPMLVCSGQKIHILADKTVIPRHSVRQHYLICVADVRRF